MNTVIQFPRQQPETPQQPTGGRMADCDDGYTRLANDILETSYKLRINGNAMSVLLAIVRMTYGWNKPRDRIAGVQLADETGLNESEVSLALKTLLARKIITAIGDKRKVKTIGINRNTSEWILCKPTRSLVQKQNSSCANTKSELCKHTNTKDISPNTLPQRQDLNTFGAGTADAAPDPVVEQDRIPIGAAIHEKTGKTMKWGTAEDLVCAQWFIDIRAKAFTAKGLSVPKSQPLVGWVNDIRLMREHDKRSHLEICQLFSFVCHTGRELEFCQAPKTLRDKWDQLQLKKANSERGVTGNQKPLSNIAAAQEAARAAKESGIGAYDDETILS